MRALLLLSLLMCVAACAYDPLGVDALDETSDAGDEVDAGHEPDAGEEPDAGHVDVTVAEVVDPGCPATEGWCSRTPRFPRAGQGEPQAPGYLNAVMATSSDGVWVAGQNFQILRWNGDTWVEEHKSFGVANALWVDPSGFGVAVGNDLGNPRKRRVLLRHPDGSWTPMQVPALFEKGDLTGVWATGAEGGVRFWATTGTDLLLASSGGDAIDPIELPGDASAVTGERVSFTEAALHLGGPDGIWRRAPDGQVELESDVASASGFFTDGDALFAVGDGTVWQRTDVDLLGWVEVPTNSAEPISGCGASGSKVVRVVTSGARIHRRGQPSWTEETVTAPAGAVLNACVTLSDGSGWAVGYVVPSGGGGFPGLVLRQRP